MSQQKTLTRILIIGSIVAFVGSTVFFTVMDILNRPQPLPQATANNQLETAAQQLATLEKQFEQVLAREPDNRNALQNLYGIRTEMQNFTGAIEPLEKLVALNPDEPVLQEELEVARLRVKLQAQDYEGITNILEKLVELNPEKYQPALDKFQQDWVKQQEIEDNQTESQP